MKLEGQKIDISLFTFVDDLMVMLNESTPGAVKLRDSADDKKLTQELGRAGAKQRKVSSGGWGRAPERI